MAGKLSTKQRTNTALAYLRSLDMGKKSYRKADELFEKLFEGGCAPGTEINLPGNRTATIVDQFASKNKVWKQCGVSRYTLEVREAPEA